MANLKLVALAFFKNKGVNYYLNHEQKIIFSCFFCTKEAALNLKDTKWKCENCRLSGTLADLIRNESQNLTSHIRLYNPKQEFWSINSKFKKIIENSGSNKKEMISLHYKIEKLFNYLFDKQKR